MNHREVKLFVPIVQLQSSETPVFPAPSPICPPLKYHSSKHSLKSRPHLQPILHLVICWQVTHFQYHLFILSSFPSRKKCIYIYIYISFFRNCIPLYLMPLNTSSLTTVIGKFSVKAAELSNRLVWSASHTFTAGLCFITDLCRDVHKLHLLLRNLSNCNWNQQDALKDWVWASLLRRCFC